MIWIHRFMLWALTVPATVFFVFLSSDTMRPAMFAWLNERWGQMTFAQAFLIVGFVALYTFGVIWTGRNAEKARRAKYKVKLHEIFHGLSLQDQCVVQVKTLEHLNALIEHIEEDNLCWAEWLLNNMGEAALHKFWSRAGTGMRTGFLWSAPDVSEEDKQRRTNVIFTLRDRARNIEAMLETDKFDPVRPIRKRTWYGRKIEPKSLRPPSEGDGRP